MVNTEMEAYESLRSDSFCAFAFAHIAPLIAATLQL